MHNYIYLGCSHTDNSGWINESQRQCLLASSTIEGISIRGLNPFHRVIDESNNKIIVRRDLSILQDKRLTHVVLKSCQPGATLSTGAASECIISCFLAKPIIVIGEPEINKVHPNNGSITPNWYHPFVEYFATAIVMDITEAINWICEDIRYPKQRKSLAVMLEEANANFQFAVSDLDPFD